MAVELYIQDKLVDLKGDEDIAIDYAIFSPDQIDKRKGAASYSFTLPKTTNNRAIFENPDDVNNLSAIPYSRLNARMLVDGIDVGIKFCVLKLVRSGYSINLYGGNSNFFDAIKDRKLSSFNFCTLNHTWDKTTIINSRTNTTGFIYPIIDYHTDSPNTWIDNTNRDIHVDNMYPSVFYDTVLTLCINDVGYTLDNEVPQDNLLLAYSGHPFVRVDDGDYMVVKAETTSDQSASYNIFHQMFFAFDTLTQTCNFWDIGTTVGEVQFNFQDTVTIEGRLYWLLDNTSGSPVTVDLWMGSDINGTPEFQQSITLATGVNTIDYNFTLTNGTPDKYSRVIYFTIYDPADTAITVKSGSYVDINSVTVNEVFYIDKDPYVSLTPYITPTSIFGEVTFAELLKAYCQMFGLIMVVDEFNKIVRLVKFDTIIGNNNIYDWSNKLDLSQEPEITFGDEDYGATNTLTYSLDNDEPKPNGTDGSILLVGNRTNEEKNIVDLMFGATNNELMLNDMNISKIGVLVNNSRQQQRLIRVLRVRWVDTADLDPNTQFGYKDGSTTYVTTDLPITYFIDTNRNDNLGFGISLIDTYYIALKGIIQNFKKVSCLVRLNSADINQLDFTRPVWIEYFNSYFYISQISAYTPTNNESTTVELVKLF